MFTMPGSVLIHTFFARRYDTLLALLCSFRYPVAFKPVLLPPPPLGRHTRLAPVKPLCFRPTRTAVHVHASHFSSSRGEEGKFSNLCEGHQPLCLAVVLRPGGPSPEAQRPQVNNQQVPHLSGRQCTQWVGNVHSWRAEKCCVLLDGLTAKTCPDRLHQAQVPAIFPFVPPE